MSLSRASLVAAIAGDLREPLALAEIDPVDLTGHLKEPIDRTFRALGVAEDDLATATVATGSEAVAIAYATYFVFDRLTTALSDQVNMASVGSRADMEQIYTHMKERAENALLVAQGFGLVVNVSGTSAAVPLIYVGGLDVADYEVIAEDDSVMPRLFSLADLGFRTGSPENAVGQ